MIKPPILLKTILDVLFWFSLLGLISKILFTLYYFFTDIPASITINEYEVTNFDGLFALGVLGKVLISATFIYIIYLLRKVVRSFFKRKIFTPLQISGLQLIGKLIIFTTLAEILLEFFLFHVYEKKAVLSLEFDTSFNSLWFILALGLFFLLLSKSFSYARNLQEENELTV